MKILVSTSATARQQSNAKAVFGSKAVSILKALEEASKEKTLATPGLDAFLADLKLTGEAFETVSSKASFTKAVAAAKAFVSAKTFTAKIAALKSLKYSSVTGVFPSKAKLAKLKENPDTLRYTKNSKRSKMEDRSAKKSSSGSIKTYEDLMEVMSANEDKFGVDSDKALAAFESIFGFKPVDGTSVGVGTSSEDVGIYCKNESNVVLSLSTDAPGIAHSLGVKQPGVYMVYADSYKDEGPFLGSIRPIAGTKKVFKDLPEAMSYFAELSEKANKQSAAKGALFLADEGIPKLHGDLTFYYYKKADKVIIVPVDDSFQQDGKVDAIEIPKSALPTKAVFNKIMDDLVSSYMIGSPQFESPSNYCKRNKFILRSATSAEIKRESALRSKLSGY